MSGLLYLIPIFLLMLLAVVSKSVVGENLDTHIHGVVELAIVLEENTLQVEFHSPSANLIGFEHKASTEKEKQVVAQAESWLASPKELFRFDGVLCQVTKIIVDMSGVIDSEQEEHDHSGHNGLHSEITASYLFNCTGSKRLRFFSVALFKKFPGIKKINAVWVTETEQGSELLTSKNNTVPLGK